MIGSVFVTALSLMIGQHGGHESPVSKTVGEILQRTEIRFFGDVYGRYLDDKLGSPRTTFGLGNLDLYVLGHLSEEWSALAESSIEFGEDQSSGIDVERLQVNWSPRSWFQVTAGRFHSPLGYWPTAFHHGKWMYTTVEAPLMSKFEDQKGPLPVHTVGILIYGRLALSGSLELQYDIGGGNGRGPTPDPVLSLQDISNRKAVLAGLHLYVEGLRFGAAGYLDDAMVRSSRDAPASAPADTSMNEQILVADATYTTAPWEVLVEYALVRHTFNKGTPVINHMGYAQISYTVAEGWRPYARGEFQQISGKEIYLASPREKRVFAGFRLDPVPPLAVKLEGAMINRQDQWGFLAQAQVAWVM